MKHERAVLRVLALGQRCWLGYMRTQRRELLHEANHAVIIALAQRPGNPELSLMLIALNIELGNLEAAAEQLDAQAPYRGHYRSSQPAVFANIQSLRAMLCIKQADIHGLNQAVRNLADFVKNTKNKPNVQQKGRIITLLGSAYLACNKLPEAMAALEEAHATGCRSALLLANSYMLLRKRINIKGNSALVIDTLHWGICHGLAVGGLIEFYAEHIALPERTSIWLYEAFLRECSKNWLISRVCASLMVAGEYSPRAANIYRLAEKRQLALPGLAEAVMFSAFTQGREDISIHCLRHFLESPPRQNYQLSAFAYHILLGSKRFADIASARIGEILEFAKICLRLGLKGRYVNSVYCRLLEQGIDKNKGVFPANLEALASALEPHLFSWQIEAEHPDASLLWVSERAKAQPEAYVLENATAIVQATGPGFVCKCFAEGGRLLNADIRRVRLGGRPSYELLYAYFLKGCRREELSISLAQYHIALTSDPKINAGQHRTKLERGIGVLQYIISLPRISRRLRSRARSAIGASFALLGQNREAAHSYASIPERDIPILGSSHALGMMFASLAENGDSERAIKMAAIHFKHIGEVTLFRGFKKLLGTGLAGLGAELRTQAAGIAYGLMCRSWFDKRFMPLVLEYYSATHDEWQTLADTLYILDEEDTQLHERLLESAFRLRRIDRGAQRVFASLRESRPNSPAVVAFALACSYEIIWEGFIPEPATAEILESMFRKGGDARLAYAIVSMYMVGGKAAPGRDEAVLRAVNQLNKRNILHPAIYGAKEHESLPVDAAGRLPFIYRSIPGKDVYLLYRVLGAPGGFTDMKMEYAFFGMYTCRLVCFAGEQIEYYFSEISKSGSVDTLPQVMENTEAVLSQKSEPYSILNNALIYESMFRYDKVEQFIGLYLQDDCHIKATLIN